MIHIVTDTGANLPKAVVKEFQITVAEGSFVFGAEAVSESSMTQREFFRRLKDSPKLPLARDTSVKEFRDLFGQVIARDSSAEILSIHVSEALATTISSARQAAAMFPRNTIRLFDTQSVSMGEGLMVWEAAKAARSGSKIDAIVSTLAAMRERMQVYFVVDTLDNLAKGGRVGPVARLAGGLLNVKPILAVKNGTVQSHSQFRSRPKALSELRQFVTAACEGAENIRMAVMHALCEEDAARLADELRSKLNIELPAVAEIGPAVAVHTGPGAIGVAWFASPKGNRE